MCIFATNIKSSRIVPDLCGEDSGLHYSGFNHLASFASICIYITALLQHSSRHIPTAITPLAHLFPGSLCPGIVLLIRYPHWYLFRLTLRGIAAHLTLKELSNSRKGTS